jgi:hypothetical protein
MSSGVERGRSTYALKIPHFMVDGTSRMSDQSWPDHPPRRTDSSVSVAF